METLLTNRRDTKLELEYWNVEVGAGEGGGGGRALLCGTDL